MEDEGTGKTDPLEKIGPRRLRAAIWLFVIAGLFLFNAGSDPVCDYGDPPPRSSPDYWDWLAEEPDCEPDSVDELGSDFLDATGISKSTAQKTAWFCLFLAFLLVSSYTKHFPNKGIIFDKPFDNIERENPEPEPEKEEKWWED